MFSKVTVFSNFYSIYKMTIHFSLITRKTFYEPIAESIVYSVYINETENNKQLKVIFLPHFN